MEGAVRKARASKPKVRTGCITCKIRRVKCDEGKPACSRCFDTGRKCDGYASPASALGEPRGLQPVAPATSATESRALDFFFHTTSPQLAGFLDTDFWKRSVLQFSLAQPAIRQGLAALGSLHEYEQGWATNNAVAEQLYSRAIRSTVDKAAAGDMSVPIVVMASIIFTCFEFLRRNSRAAAMHIASGIEILRHWRQINQCGRRGQWGAADSSYEGYFLETELAPILTLFNLNSSEFGPLPRSRLILHEVENGGPKLAERFETLREARVALVDLVTASAELFQNLDNNVECRVSPTYDQMAASTALRQNFTRWKDSFQDLLGRKEATWGPEEKAAANVIRMMQLGSEVGLAAYVVSNECDWDGYTAEFEEIIRIAELLLTRDSCVRSLSLDLGLIYPLHAVAWKCRYADLRRKGLDLLLRVPRQEWLLNSGHYYAIFSRILAIEEDYTCPDVEQELPPEKVRVHDFFCLPQPGQDEDASRYAITFLTKPDGLDEAWSFTTEYIHLPGPTSDLPPSNLLSCRRWANSDASDPPTAAALKAAVFGPYISTKNDLNDVIHTTTRTCATSTKFGVEI
ncbi:hypothetical protein BJY01DRAFT_246447 [Aspergillus pseudoustus]|uniref:Zn(2)-C6 fungal-type domain-containing protein n=1 Tax=Aspergillus pseudoustus TaxID=1810923 RepID=A0ABR4K821_9EURO